MNEPRSRRWWIVAALMLSLIIVGLDTTILTVALPTLAADLRASTADLQWILDAYVLALAGLMLPAGALADRIGRKPVLLGGVAVFTLGSLAASFAGSPGQLIATRTVMGLGAAVIMSVPLAVIPSLFTPAERPRAIATMMVSMGVGLPLGPIAGGWLLQHFWWGSVFLINVPIGVLALAALTLLLPDSREATAARADLPGAALSTAGLVALVYGIVEAPLRGWTSAPALGFSVLGIALIAAFAAWERHTQSPMIDLGLLTRPRFTWGTVSATIAMLAMLGLLFVLPTYLQAVRGNDPLGTGVRLLPLIGGLVVGAKLGEALTVRLGNRLPVVAGLGAIVSGLLGGSTIAVTTPYAQIAAWLALTGFGMGLAITPAMDAALGEVPAGQYGAGSSLSMAARQVGGALGVAVLGSVLSAVYTSRLDVTGLTGPLAASARESVTAALGIAQASGSDSLARSAARAYVDGMSAVMDAGAVLGLTGMLLAALFLPPRAAHEPAARESATIGG